MKNLVKELEKQGVIPRGRFSAVFNEGKTGIYIIKTAENMIGLCTIKPMRMVLPKYLKIRKDSKGNYVCIGKKGKKFYAEVYNKESSIEMH